MSIYWYGEIKCFTSVQVGKSFEIFYFSWEAEMTLPSQVYVRKITNSLGFFSFLKMLPFRKSNGANTVYGNDNDSINLMVLTIPFQQLSFKTLLWLKFP